MKHILKVSLEFYDALSCQSYFHEQEQPKNKLPPHKAKILIVHCFSTIHKLIITLKRWAFSVSLIISTSAPKCLWWALVICSLFYLFPFRFCFKSDGQYELSILMFAMDFKHWALNYSLMYNLQVTIFYSRLMTRLCAWNAHFHSMVSNVFIISIISSNSFMSDVSLPIRRIPFNVCSLFIFSSTLAFVYFMVMWIMRIVKVK